MDIRKLKESLGLDPDSPLPFEDMKYTPAPLISMKEDEYTLMPCPCSCHRNPNMKHIVACCDRGFIKVPKTKEMEQNPNKKYPQTFKELFEGTGIEPTKDEEGNEHYNFKATKKEDDKYFTPSIEDIRVGYECEGKLVTNQWIPLKLDSNTDLSEFSNSLRENNIRVPYLTQEQIEAEGWVEGKKGRFEVQQITILQDEKRTDWLVITETIKDKQQLAFKGECKDINTFRYICKLLGI